MKIKSVQIRNFRKLKNCHIDLGDKETVFVGANNSGKTSAISAIVWFLKNTEKFTLKEFTASNWTLINKLGDQWINKETIEEIWPNPHQWDKIVPAMDVWISVEEGEQYKVNHLIPSLSTWDGKIVGVRCQYEPKDVVALCSAYKQAKEKALSLMKTEEWENASSPELFPKNLCDFLGKGSNLKDYFNVNYYIIDYISEPQEEDETQETPDNKLNKNPFEELIRVDSIFAYRDFSDPQGQSDSEIDTLSRQFQKYYTNSNSEDEALTPEDLGILNGILNANKTYDNKLIKAFETPVEELKNINYPGFQNPNIKIKSKIQIEDAIKHESAVQFAIQGADEFVLPEKYNGLGYRNLISIYLRLMDFREQWLKPLNHNETIPPIHLVFVEEPEAHLHAQAQQVFVRKAFDALRNNQLIEDNKWLNTQLVLSTHSNHVVNELDLNCMRYFRRITDSDSTIPISKVINLSNTFGSEEETKRFVTRYIRLTHCDIFFADAVILVEGPSEKILVPRFIQKMSLDAYYISIIEVNGRHANSFRNLIERLDIPTLIVTDIDALKEETGDDGKKCNKPVIPEPGKNYETGNPSIKSWIVEKDTIDELLALDDEHKIKNNVRIAYQTPTEVKWIREPKENSIIYPYTFEDALIMKNLELFHNEELKKLGTITTIANLVEKSQSVADLQSRIFEKLSNFQKADFANQLLYTKKFDDLTAPVYIQEGLEWLKQYLDNKGKNNGK